METKSLELPIDLYTRLEEYAERSGNTLAGVVALLLSTAPEPMQKDDERPRTSKRARSGPGPASSSSVDVGSCSASSSSSAAADGGASSAGVEPRLDALPDELLVHIVRSIGLRDVLLCRPYQVCRRLRGVLRTIVWDELDLAPPEAEIRAVKEALKSFDCSDAIANACAQFNASHMQRLKRMLASLHRKARFAAWGSARALRLRFSSICSVNVDSEEPSEENDAADEIEEARKTVEVVRNLARASPTIGTVRVEFRGQTFWEDESERTDKIFDHGHPRDSRWPRIKALLLALGAMPNLSRLELGRDVEESGGFFAWNEFIDIHKNQRLASTVLSPFRLLQHLSLPFPLGAEYIRILLRVLPALRSVDISVPYTQLRLAVPFLSDPRLDSVKLRIVESYYRLLKRGDTGSYKEEDDIGPVEAIEVLAGTSRAAQVIKDLEISDEVMEEISYTPETGERFFNALARLSGLQRLLSPLKIFFTGWDDNRGIAKHAAPLARISSLKEVSLYIHRIVAGLELEAKPLADALNALPKHTKIDIKVHGDVHAVKFAASLRRKLHSCKIYFDQTASDDFGLQALTDLEPWTGLTVQTNLGHTTSDDRLGAMRALAGALRDAGKLILSSLVHCDADLEALALLAPLGPRLRLDLSVDLFKKLSLESFDRLWTSTLALLRDGFAASSWKVSTPRRAGDEDPDGNRKFPTVRNGTFDASL